MRIVRWMAAVLTGLSLALAFVAMSGYIALVAWDRTHPPLLPGMERGKQQLQQRRQGGGRTRPSPRVQPGRLVLHPTAWPAGALELRA